MKYQPPHLIFPSFACQFCLPTNENLGKIFLDTIFLLQNQVTVLNIETGHISGVAYSGSLVRGVEHYGRRLFNSNSALQTSLQSILVSLGLKIYLHYHLHETTSRSANDILKAIGVAKGDWDIVIYLSGMIQTQLQKSVGIGSQRKYEVNNL